MSSDADSWNFWLKLIFVLACCMVVIVGLALFANAWTNRTFRKQIKYQQQVNQEQGALVFRPWIHERSRKRKNEDHDAQSVEKVYGLEARWQSKPYSAFGLSYHASDTSSEIPSSKQSAMLPPKPEMNDINHHGLAERPSRITLLPSPDIGLSNEPPRPPLHHARGSKTSISQFQEMPGEEAGYIPASPNVMHPYMHGAEAHTADQHIYVPYRNVNTSVSQESTSRPSTQRYSVPIKFYHRVPSSTYNSSLVQAPATHPEMDNDSGADDASQITTIPIATPMHIFQCQSTEPQHDAPRMDSDGDANFRPYSMEPQASSEPMVRNCTISPIDIEIAGFNMGSHRNSGALVSPQQDQPLLSEADLTSLPLSPIRGSVDIAEGLELSPLSQRFSGISENVPQPLRHMSAGPGMGMWGMRRDVNYLDHITPGAMSVVSSAGTSKPKKLQKRRRSEGLVRGVSWLRW